MPLHCTASGKLFLSQLNALERNAMLARLTLKKMTYRTLTDAQLLAAELDRLAARGVGIDNEEFVRGMVAVAVPVKEAESGRVLAALAVHRRPRARRSTTCWRTCRRCGKRLRGSRRCCAAEGAPPG